MFILHTLITYWLIFKKILLLVVTDKINKISLSGQDEAAEDNLLCYRGSLAQGEENRIGFRRNNLS